jgi:hypothetical protein
LPLNDAFAVHHPTYQTGADLGKFFFRTSFQSGRRYLAVTATNSGYHPPMVCASDIAVLLWISVEAVIGFTRFCRNWGRDERAETSLGATAKSANVIYLSRILIPEV